MDPQFPKFDAKAFVNKSNPRDEKINPVIPIIPIMNQEVYQQIYTRELGVDRPKICHLDLRGFNEGENVAIFPSCNHIIHLSCIEVWNKTNPGRCPSCYMIERDNKIQEDQNRIDPNLAYPIIVGPRV